MELVAQQFMRALRGKRSQQALARRLGYRANPITDWEHGRRYPTAEEALRVAALLRVDVVAGFAQFAPAVRLQRTPAGFEVAQWLSELCAATSTRELAQRSGVSPFALRRWLSGVRKPRLPDFFRVVDGATARLPDLVAALAPIAEVPALAERFETEQAARTLAFDEPWSEAILRVLETSAYRAQSVHRDGYIAACLGIDVELEQRIMARLQLARIIERRAGLYAALRPLNVSTRRGQEVVNPLKQHWARLAAERAGAPHADDLFAYSLVSVSRADRERIRQRLLETYREIRSIVAASDPAECVALLNLQVMGWSDGSTS